MTPSQGLVQQIRRLTDVYCCCCCMVAAAAAATFSSEDENIYSRGGKEEARKSVPRVACYFLMKETEKALFYVSPTGEARRKAIPSFLEPARRREMPRAPPRCSAETQMCVVVYPRPPCFAPSRKCEKEPSAAEEQHAKKRRSASCTYTLQ